MRVITINRAYRYTKAVDGKTVEDKQVTRHSIAGTFQKAIEIHEDIVDGDRLHIALSFEHEGQHYVSILTEVTE